MKPRNLIQAESFEFLMNGTKASVENFLNGKNFSHHEKANYTQKKENHWESLGVCVCVHTTQLSTQRWSMSKKAQT